MLSQLPLHRIEVSAGAPRPEPGQWPATIPAVRQLLEEGGLDLGPATILVGENGSGKSTLIEAMAIAFGLNPEGGSTGARHRTRPSESSLASCLYCVRNGGASRWGFFLRAETMHSFFTYLEENPGAFDPNYHELSHGESFRALLDSNRFVGSGFYVLDEPESALSFTAELTLLAQLIDLAASGTAQILMSTHSPVLAALPGARVLELGTEGYAEAAWEDLDMVRHYRSFLASPQRYLRHFTDPSPDS